MNKIVQDFSGNLVLKLAKMNYANKIKSVNQKLNKVAKEQRKLF